MRASERRIEAATVPLYFAAKDPLTFRVRSVVRSRLRMIEVDYGMHGNGNHADFPRLEDTYTIGVRYCPEESRASVHGQTFDYGSPSGFTHFLDLSGVDFVELNTRSHTIELLLPRPFLEDVANDLELQVPRRLGNEACFLTADPVIPSLVQRLRPYLDDPAALDALQADSFMWSLAIYAMRTYGGLADHRPRKGGLTISQERLAKEWIETVLPVGTTLAEVAAACGLGVSRFAHAFRETTGVSPYRWLVERRVNRAKSLLDFSLPLADIALSCGFADQSHMTRTFKRATGMAPRTWQLTHQVRVSPQS